MFTAICVLMIQASAKLPPPPEPEPEPDATAPGSKGSTPGKAGRGKKGSNASTPRAPEPAAASAPTAPTAPAEAPEHPLASVSRLSMLLLRTLVGKTLERASDDPEPRALLEDFTRDLLLLLGRPEWPAAHMAVEKLGYLLCQRLREGAAKDKEGRREKAADAAKELAARGAALEQLGAILAALCEHRRQHLEAPLVFPAPRDVADDDDAQPGDEGEITGCSCGVPYDPKSEVFMLDCDMCHRWFHGDCVGIAPDGQGDIPTEWFCDHCRLSTAVTQQRQSIARLLALPNGGRGDDGDDPMDAHNSNIRITDPAESKSPRDAREKPRRSAAAADAGEGGRGVASGLLAELCSETETTKQLVINYLQGAAAGDGAADSALVHLLCEWHASAAKAERAPLCELYQEQYASALTARRRQRGLGVADAEARQMPLLSREGILAAGRRLLHEAGLYTKIEPMLTYLLGVLKDPAPSARARAVKALRGVVCADPASLTFKGVHTAVAVALADPSIAVREATLDLLGSYLSSRPEFMARYYSAIAARLADPGVSVRKQVIKILRDLCIHAPSSELAIDACCRLVGRLGPSEEDVVRRGARSPRRGSARLGEARRGSARFG